MVPFIIRRLLSTVLMIFLVALVVFMLGNLTGDPVQLMVTDMATEEDIEELRRSLGLDRPLPIRFADFMINAVQGDLGTSLRHSRPALSIVMERMPATVELSGAAMAIALLVAIPAGIVSALKRGSAVDAVVSVFTVVGQSMPAFWIGIMLIILFSVTLGVLPAAGRGDPGSLVLPAVTLGLWPMARIARVLRSSLLEVMHEDYIRTAYSKGLGPPAVLLRHQLRNALIPVVTVTALTFGTVLGGTVITESVFAWPGVGRLALEAIHNRDLPLLQATVFVVAVIFVAINLFLDLLYVWLDPRIRLT